MAEAPAGRSYRAAPPATLRFEPLDAVLTAVFHRASGITHLIAEPAPEILAALADGWLTEAALFARLCERFDLGDVDPRAMSARLAELVVAGLIEMGPVEVGPVGVGPVGAGPA